MAYGVAGDPAVSHLFGLLSDTKRSGKVRVLQIARSLGTEAEVPQISSFLDSARDKETVTACVAYLMEVGGPSGRAAVLALNPDRLDSGAGDYLKEIRPKVAAMSYSVLVDADASLNERVKPQPSDREVQRLLDTMEARDGLDHDTQPQWIANSGIPKDRLVAQLRRIRTRSFRRENNHVFEDLEVTNQVINTLQFKAPLH